MVTRSVKALSQRAEEAKQRELELSNRVKTAEKRQKKVELGMKKDANLQKKIKKYDAVKLMTLEEAIQRKQNWENLPPAEKIKQTSNEYAFWRKQLQTQNARNRMSYRRNGSRGIIGGALLDVKMEYQ